MNHLNKTEEEQSDDENWIGKKTEFALKLKAFMWPIVKLN